MSECLFCMIADGRVPVSRVYEDERVVAFADTTPQAPSHFLFIPKQHFADVAKVPPDLLGHLLKEAAAFAEAHLPDGFRVVINTGEDGGQTVMHLHLHVLGGRSLTWPPG